MGHRPPAWRDATRRAASGDADAEAWCANFARTHAMKSALVDSLDGAHCRETAVLPATFTLDLTELEIIDYAVDELLPPIVVATRRAMRVLDGWHGLERWRYTLRATETACVPTPLVPRLVQLRSERTLGLVWQLASGEHVVVYGPRGVPTVWHRDAHDEAGRLRSCGATWYVCEDGETTQPIRCGDRAICPVCMTAQLQRSRASHTATWQVLAEQRHVLFITTTQPTDAVQRESDPHVVWTERDRKRFGPPPAHLRVAPSAEEVRKWGPDVAGTACPGRSLSESWNNIEGTHRAIRDERWQILVLERGPDGVVRPHWETVGGWYHRIVLATLSTTEATQLRMDGNQVTDIRWHVHGHDLAALELLGIDPTRDVRWVPEGERLVPVLRRDSPFWSTWVRAWGRALMGARWRVWTSDGRTRPTPLRGKPRRPRGCRTRRGHVEWSPAPVAQLRAGSKVVAWARKLRQLRARVRVTARGPRRVQLRRRVAAMASRWLGCLPRRALARAQQAQLVSALPELQRIEAITEVVKYPGKVSQFSDAAGMEWWSDFRGRHPQQRGAGLHGSTLVGEAARALAHLAAHEEGLESSEWPAILQERAHHERPTDREGITVELVAELFGRDPESERWLPTRTARDRVELCAAAVLAGLREEHARLSSATRPQFVRGALMMGEDPDRPYLLTVDRIFRRLHAGIRYAETFDVDAVELCTAGNTLDLRVLRDAVTTWHPPQRDVADDLTPESLENCS